MTAYLTKAEVAERFGKSVDFVSRKVTSRQWPHIRIGRTIYFLPEHVEQIEKIHTVRAVSATANTFGQKGRRSA